MNKVAIIGAGKVGTAMGYLLRERGYCIVGVASRTLDSAKKAIDFIGEGEASTNLTNTAEKAEIVFITTSDGAIKDVCKKIASEGGFQRGSVVFHMSGALPSDVLSSARDAGAHIASVHPLQSLADVREALSNFLGSYFCIEGDEEAVSVAQEIVAALKGKEIMLHVDKKPLYHAGATVVSNYLVATIGFGLELYEAAGITIENSLKALMPLIKGTIKNIEAIGIPSALTGPIARGDAEIVECHLNALSKERQGLVRLYTELGRYTVEVAIEKGTLKKKDAQKIISLFDKYDEGLRYN
jgi:predicted short-subunit dehydrogenase-like oxidoreductase (DUF2520 family)